LRFNDTNIKHIMLVLLEEVHLWNYREMKQEARQALIFILINNRRDLKSGGSLAKAVA
jgi:hypothetical protein